MTFITSLFEKGLFKFNVFTTVIKQFPQMKFIHVIDIILCMTKLHVRCCHHFVSVLVISVVIFLCLSLSSVLSSLCVCPCHPCCHHCVFLSSVLSSLCVCPCHQCCHHFVSVLVISVVVCVCYLFTGQFHPLNSLEQIEPILAKMLFDGCQHLYDYRFIRKLNIAVGPVILSKWLQF